jgi:hypothetical protein
MKKTIIAICLTLAALNLSAQTGVIRELSGTVELKAPGSSSYTPAKAGDTVTQATLISTGFKSMALIEVGSALLTVRPLTRLTLTEIHASSGTETLNVNLQSGRVRVDVNPPAGSRASMSVSSPIATASVRGTSFEFDTRNIRVNHGQVSFLGRRGTPMPVDAGSATHVEPSGKAADPIETRVTGLRPRAPAGSDTGGSSAAGSALPASGTISIELQFPKT